MAVFRAITWASTTPVLAGQSPFPDDTVGHRRVTTPSREWLITHPNPPPPGRGGRVDLFDLLRRSGLPPVCQAFTLASRVAPSPYARWPESTRWRLSRPTAMRRIEPKTGYMTPVFYCESLFAYTSE